MRKSFRREQWRRAVTGGGEGAVWGRVKLSINGASVRSNHCLLGMGAIL